MESALFHLEKFIASLLMPVSIILLLQFWALLFLLRRKTRWLGFGLVLLATGLLFAACYAPLSSQLTGPLEQRYPSYRPGSVPASHIAVLGHGHVSTEELPVTSQLSSTGVVRLAEGIRIYRLNPGSKLILTGFPGRDPVSYTEIIKELALGLGVPAEDILTFSGPKNTAEEAQLLAAQFADASLVLVTSAAHMPRAMALFHGAGLHPIPAPTNHLTRPFRSKWIFPKAETLARTQAWWHEQLGLVWAKLMGQVQPRPQEE